MRLESIMLALFSAFFYHLSDTKERITNKIYRNISRSKICITKEDYIIFIYIIFKIYFLIFSKFYMVLYYF